MAAKRLDAVDQTDESASPGYVGRSDSGVATTTDHFHCPQADTSTASANDSGMASPNLRDQQDRTNANPECETNRESE